MSITLGWLQILHIITRTVQYCFEYSFLQKLIQTIIIFYIDIIIIAVLIISNNVIKKRNLKKKLIEGSYLWE